MRTFVNATFLVLMLVTQAGWAKTSNTKTECDPIGSQTQLNMNACAYEDFLAASAGYAESHSTVARRLSGKQRSLFLRSQSAWLNYRTAACDFESSGLEGGSAQVMVKWQCSARMTRARALELASIGNCTEGEIACFRPSAGGVQVTPERR